MQQQQQPKFIPKNENQVNGKRKYMHVYAKKIVTFFCSNGYDDEIQALPLILGIELQSKHILSGLNMEGVNIYTSQHYRTPSFGIFFLSSWLFFMRDFIFREKTSLTINYNKWNENPKRMWRRERKVAAVFPNIPGWQHCQPFGPSLNI